MDIFEFAKKTIDYAKTFGFTESEIYYSNSKSLDIGVYEKEIDDFSINKSKGVGFRGIYKDKMGYSFTEIFDDESVKMLVERAKENAELIDDEEVEHIFGEKHNYKEIETYNKDIDEASISDKKKLTLNLESNVLNLDKRIDKVARTGYSDAYGEVGLINSKGLKLFHKSNILYLYSQGIAKDGEETVDGSDYEYYQSYSSIDIDKLSKSIVDKVISKTGAKEINSGKYKIVLENSSAGSLLSTFADIFSAEAAQKGMSLLSDKEGEIISSPIVNLIDNPHLEMGLNSRAFDDEGFPTLKKNIIENGVLKTLLHNIKTATKQGIKSTGNASRYSFKSTMSISPTNFYIEKGEKTLEDIFEEVENGILITEFSGLHAGANSITGDFSLASKGYLIENGKKSKAIEQVTLAGNFFELLKSIEIIGNDLKFKSSIVSPSLYIGELSVAGKK
ncbi:MAG: TldD/PmbA family protein [Clostridiales bacterium]